LAGAALGLVLECRIGLNLQTRIGVVHRFSTNEETLREAQKRFDAVCEDPASPTACVADFRLAVFKIVLRACAGNGERLRHVRHSAGPQGNSLTKMMASGVANRGAHAQHVCAAQVAV
jgi:hypothetical protein